MIDPAPAGEHRDVALGGHRPAGVAGRVQVRDLLGAAEEDELDGEEVIDWRARRLCFFCFCFCLFVAEK